MYLRANELCPFADKCPHLKTASSYCHGANSDRPGSFTCDYVDSNGNFTSTNNEARNKYDLTGKMEILSE